MNKMTTEEMIERLRNPLMLRKGDYERIASRIEEILRIIDANDTTDAEHDAAYGRAPVDAI